MRLEHGGLPAAADGGLVSKLKSGLDPGNEGQLKELLVQGGT